MTWLYVLMILSLILNLLFLVILIIGSVGVWAFVSKLLKSNLFYQDQNNEYKQFFDEVTQILFEDTLFLRSDIVKRFGANIPEIADLNSSMINFENKIIAIRKALEQYKLVD